MMVMIMIMMIMMIMMMMEERLVTQGESVVNARGQQRVELQHDSKSLIPCRSESFERVVSLSLYVIRDRFKSDKIAFR